MREDVESQIIFIEEVKKHPKLYIFDRPTFLSDRAENDSIWATIAEKLGENVDSCKRRWKSIRSSYRRSLMDKNRPTYYLSDHLVFLKEYFKQIPDEKTEPQAELPTTNLRKNYDMNAQSFLMSLLPQVEALSEEQFHHFQSDVAILLEKIKHPAVI